jgi:hypothetical protein
VRPWSLSPKTPYKDGANTATEKVYTLLLKNRLPIFATGVNRKHRLSVVMVQFGRRCKNHEYRKKEIRYRIKGRG